MHLGRLMAVTTALLLFLGSVATAQRNPAKQSGDVRITKLTPTSFGVGNHTATLVIEGAGFQERAVVRVREDKGSGVDIQADVESQQKLTVTIPTSMLDKPKTLEVRVKNPDDSVSDWVSLEVRPTKQPPIVGDDSAFNPVIERVSPTQIAVGSRDAYVTLFGRGFIDRSTIVVKSDMGTTEVVANLNNNGLVFKFPEGQASRSHAVTVQIRTPKGVLSDPANIDVVPTSDGNSTTGANDPFIIAAEPAELDFRKNREQTVRLTVRNADTERSYVLIRPEGSSGAGARVLIGSRASSSGGSVFEVQVTPATVGKARAVELRVVNPNGRESNWSRLAIAGATPAPNPLNAVVAVQFPESVTLTAAKATLPVEVSVKNQSPREVIVDQFALAMPDGSTTALTESLSIPGQSERTLRIEAPVSLALGVGQRTPVKLQLALTYQVRSTMLRIAPLAGRSPTEGFAPVSLRNEIGLVNIGREFVEAASDNDPRGWRFFNADNENKQGVGELADFYLFAEPLVVDGKRTGDELTNFRPDDVNPRGLFYLVMRSDEVTTQSTTDRERGRSLGHVQPNSLPGLVPLYRWVRRDGRAASNHFLTVENDESRLPRQLRNGRWKMDRIVGYVIRREPTRPSPR